MNEHTGLPWKLNIADDIIMILDSNDNYVATVQLQQIGGGVIADIMADTRKARAEYIVRACNCHDDMLEMLKYLKNRLLLMEQYEGLPAPGILRENIKRTGFIIAKAQAPCTPEPR